MWVIDCAPQHENLRLLDFPWYSKNEAGKPAAFSFQVIYYRTSLTKANGTKYSAFSVPTDPRLVFEVTALRTACRLHFAAAFVLSERKIDHCAGHSPLLAAGALFVQDAIVVFVASTAITCEPCRKNHQCDDTLSMFWNGPNRLSMIQGLQRD